VISELKCQFVHHKLQVVQLFLKASAHLNETKMQIDISTTL
jgi:hypothetical protein